VNVKWRERRVRASRGRSLVEYIQRPQEMIVYRDLLTGDEMLSDAFPLKEVIDTDGTKVSIFFFALVVHVFLAAIVIKIYAVFV
jgi:hypothetical protein